MSEFVYPYPDAGGYGYSDADRAEIELLADAVAETEILLRQPADQHKVRVNVSLGAKQIATDTVVNLDDWR